MNIPAPDSSPWDGDLLGREREAELLLEFLESVISNGPKRDWARAYTLSVDGDYGAGKSYFLKRFAAHVATRHPVALVDAWADDVQDEPLVALVATLERAFSDFIANSPVIRSQWNNVVRKSGNIAKIVSLGLLRRGAGFLITQAAADGVAAAFSEVDMVPGELDDAIKSEPQGLFTGASGVDSATYMQNELQAFREAKQSIESLKAALTALISSLKENGLNPPVFIIIDEIDRCRPTYAIKLFEQIKHLLDVEGLVFVFGTNQRALSKSVAAAYGPNFDGWAYLRRLINKTYRLKEPNLEPLIQSLFEQLNVDPTRLQFPRVEMGSQRQISLPPSRVIADYMSQYERQPRDAFYVVETIQTCLALTEAQPLLLGYLMPLILSSMMEPYRGTVIEPDPWNSPWSIQIPSGKITPSEYVRKIITYSGMTVETLMDRIDRNGADGVAIEIFRLLYEGNRSVQASANPKGYPDLLETVARFG